MDGREVMEGGYQANKVIKGTRVPGEPGYRVERVYRVNRGYRVSGEVGEPGYRANGNIMLTEGVRDQSEDIGEHIAHQRSRALGKAQRGRT